MITTFDEVRGLALGKSTTRATQLEGPQEVVDGLESGSDSVKLMNNVLHADDALLAELLFDDGIVLEGNALTVDLGMTTFVNKLTDGLKGRSAVGDVGLDDAEHVDGGLGQADEDTVVDLTQAEELKNLAWLGAHLVDTLDADDEGELGLGGYIEGVGGAGEALKADFFTLLGTVLGNVSLGTLEGLGAGLAAGLLFLCRGLRLGGTGLFDGLTLLQDIEGNLGDGSNTGRTKERRVSP